ncbi:MAG: hypothetical protein H7A46_19080 [Verrucomicrobiales bacterium]|nr:hypothetical protein [Verrucomicrobiales bacterium]
MTGSSQNTVRRATLDDLAVLRGLWSTARLPVFEMEPRLTQFQMAFRPDDTAMGAIGLQVVGWHGLLHSPCFYSAAEEAVALPLLWEHLQQIAGSKGLARIWMAGPLGGFWQETGFKPANPAELNRLPPSFKLPTGQARWWTLALRDDAAIAQALEHEFTKLREEGKVDTERLRNQAMLWRGIGWLMVVLILVGAIWLALRILPGVLPSGGR